MKTTYLIRIIAGILFILVLAQGVQAAKPTPTPTPPAETYSLVKTLPFNGTPWGIAVDSSHGWIYIADHQSSYINKFDTAGNLLKCWTSVNWGLAADKDGYVYTDGVNGTGYDNIYKFDSNGTSIKNISTTYLSGNRGLAVDNYSNIFVAEWGTGKVEKYNSSGNLMPWSPSTLLNHPEGVAVDSDKWVYVTDNENKRIQRFNYNTGNFDSKWVLSGFSNRNGQYSGAEGIAVDTAGNIYVTDASNSNAQKYTSEGTLITYWGHFDNPSSIDVDKYGNVYIAGSTGIAVYTSSLNQINAAFTTDTTSGPVPLTVTFTDHSTGASTYSWDFGDKETSDLPSPSHQYKNASNYLVTLTVTGPGAPFTDTETKTIIVNKVDATLDVTGYTGTYDGAAHGASGTATGKEGVDMSSSSWEFGTTFIDVPGGTAHWKFTGGTNYNDQNGDAAIVISKADADVSVSGYTGTYDAAPHGATGSAKGIGGVALTGLDLGSSFTDVPGGTATWAFTNANYADESGSVGIDISKADAVFDIKPYDVPYDGNEHIATGTATGVKGEALPGLNLDGTKHTDAGDYPNDGWIFPASTNYNAASGTVHDVISMADATISVIPYSVTYDGNEHIATGTATGAKGEALTGLNLDGTKHTDAGDYPNDGWIFPASTNYNAASGTVHDVISEALKANFEGTPFITGQDPLEVQFTDKSTGSPTSWLWDFGNGNTFSTENIQDLPPLQSYSADPNSGERFYTVTLTVGKQGVSDTVTQTHYITVTPLESDVVAQAVEDVENLVPTIEGTMVSAGEKPLKAGSCISTIGCNCMEAGNNCPRVPTCPGSDPNPSGVFIDVLSNIAEPPNPPVWKGGNYEKDCGFYFACTDGSVIKPDGSIIEDCTGTLEECNAETLCKSPPIENGLTFFDDSTGGIKYADSEIVDPYGYRTPNDPKAWSPAGCTENCTNYYALLIDGGVDRDNNYARYWFDIAFMYTTLIEYGYRPDHIKVLMSDGTNNSAVLDSNNIPLGYDRKISNTGTRYDSSPVNLDGNATTDETPYIYTATRAVVNSTLESYNNTIHSDDTLFIFTTGHGQKDTYASATQMNNTVKLSLWNNEYLTDKQIVQKLNAINCKAIIMVMEQCYGGGFYDEFIVNRAGYGVTQNRTLITASWWNESSWANGFSNAWTTGVAGHFWDASESNSALEPSADTSLDLRISMKESYDYPMVIKGGRTLRNDPFATTGLTLQTGKEHPQIWSNYSGSLNQSTQFLNDCYGNVLKTIQVTKPTTEVQWPAGSQNYILWKETGIPYADKVNITLLKNNLHDSIINSSVNATQKYFKWIIPVNQATGIRTYKVKIQSNATPTVNDTSDVAFNISSYIANGNGSLQINSDPTGARITLDNVYTPNSTNNRILNNTWPGEYLVTLEKSGWLPKTEWATVPVGGPGTKTITLTNVSGTNAPLSPINIITLDPSGKEIFGAEVFIDGIDTGNQTFVSIDVTPGEHNVSVILPCYEKPAEINVTAPPYDPDNYGEKVTFTLTPSECYTFQGFNIPVVMNAVNTFTAGKAVSLKWRLTDSAGNAVYDRTSFNSLRSFVVPCNDGMNIPSDTQPEIFTGDSNLRNQSDGNWIYVWDTPKNYKGSCRNAYVLFDSYQTSPVVRFKFI